MGGEKGMTAMSTTSYTHDRSRWTAAGADTAASNTYTSIRSALEEVERKRNVEIFLQGSYANKTNIRADSDVDIVVMTRSTFKGAFERLSASAREEYMALPTATFTHDDLRQDVTGALVAYYGSDRVHPRNKCIKVDGTAGYVDADVVPAIEYHWYLDDSDLSRYASGIAIHPQSGGTIINFPKQHIENGQIKNELCDGNYKKTVRQVKHLRNTAVAAGLLRDGVAPGYLLECMVFNAPADEFVNDDSKRLLDVVYWLKSANKANFWSCDHIHQLFKDDPGKFDVDLAQVIVDALWEAY